MAGLWIAVGAIVAGVAAGVAYRFSGRFQERLFEKARATFLLRREWLEAEFLKLAGERGIPRGLSWVNVEFEDDVQFARDRNSGQLRALIGVTIQFEAIEGGGMEDVEAVGNLRAGTAVFHFDRGSWKSDGRALFNLNPVEAIEHYRHELETID